jgi:hypothetical protein
MYVKAAVKNHDFCLESFRVKKINKLAKSSNKVRNNFASFVTSGLSSDVAHGPPI